MRRDRTAALVVGAAIGWIEPAFAQETTGGDTTIYESDDFARFKPQTVYDIALVVPDFALG